MSNIYLKTVETWHAGSGLVLATVTKSTGSTPQKPGSSALFENGRLISGTVGGGVSEGKVQEAAGKCSRSGKSLYLHFSLNSDILNREEAICGGEFYVLLDADPGIHLSVFQEIGKSLEKREQGVLITGITQYPEGHVLVNRYWMTTGNKPAIPENILEKIRPEVNRILLSADTGGFTGVEISVPGVETSSLFCMEPVIPLPRLIIAGAGHIGKALSHIGSLLDFEVTVIDDRSDFANSGNLPDADHIIAKDIGEAIAEAEKSSDTYFVIVTRGHNDDAKALKPCIGSEAVYVGMIGSKSKVAGMKAEFLEKKWATEEQWDKIHSPIGIEINSRSVQEIAVSIAAELVMVRRSIQ